MSLSQSEQMDELCKREKAKDQDSQLSKLCACRESLAMNRELLNDYLEQYAYYNEAKADYEKYLVEETQHKNRRDEFETAMTSNRFGSDCDMGMFDGDDCPDVSTAANKAGDWERDPNIKMFDNAYNGLILCKQDLYYMDICKLNDAAKKSWMDKWDAQYPPPFKVSEPIPPAEVKLSKIVCCDQNFENIQGDQVIFDDVSQKCSVKILNDIDRTLKGEKFPVPSQVPVIKPTKTPTKPAIPSQSPVKSESWWDANQKWLIPVIVIVVLALAGVGWYAFGRVGKDGDDGGDGDDGDDGEDGGEIEMSDM